MIISLIAAMARNRVIGKSNDLPWRLPDDMKYFMDTTKGHHVIMGRRNYDSIPEKFRPLPNRTNLVLTRQMSFVAPGCHMIHSLEEGMTLAAQAREHELFIIGGSEIYRLALPFASRLYLTEIHADVEGDTYFPDVDLTKWREVSRTPHGADSRHIYSFDFVVYEKK